MDSDWYATGFWPAFWITFVISYIALIASFGFLGLCIGWMGAAVIAFVVALLWPVAACVALLGIIAVIALITGH